jgi:hypothetical protein
MPRPISELLRQASCQAIKEAERPLSAHEIEPWIAQHDAILSHQLSSKCYDYVRIILSLAPTDLIMKYKYSGPSLGIDVRSTFYGLVGMIYDPSVWILFHTKHQQDEMNGQMQRVGLKRPSNSPEPPAKPTKICLFQNMPIIPPIR